MVMAALTALKSTNDDFGIYSPVVMLVVKNWCGSGIELHPKAILPPAGKSGDGKTCQFWQVQKRRRFAGLAAPPDCGEQVFFQNRPVGKQKQAVAAFQLGTGIKQRFHSRGNRGDGQHAEAMDAKTPLVNFLCPRRFVCE